MANREGREALRGAAEETLDLLSESLAPTQWGDMLKAPLERAAAKGMRGLAQKLVWAGAKVGKAMHEAVLGGHDGIVHDLLDGGASTAVKDTSGRTPIHLAAEGGNSEMVQLLILKGANKDTMDNNGYSPLYLAVCGDHVAAVLALLGAGADVRPRCWSSRKETVVQAASRLGHVEILSAMIEYGADIEGGDFPAKKTALIAAALENQVEAIDVLVDAGVNIDAGDLHGDTPLHLAANWNHVEAVLALLEHGANVNAENTSSSTPLLLAVEGAGTQEMAEVVDCLLRAGADETLVDDAGDTALDVVTAIFEDDGVGTADANRIQNMLANAPADRTWRRRGYLVMCRTHLDRMQPTPESSGTSESVAKRTRSCTMLSRTQASGRTGTVEGSKEDDRSSIDLHGLLATVLSLPEEGTFRMIVAYL